MSIRRSFFSWSISIEMMMHTPSKVSTMNTGLVVCHRKVIPFVICVLQKHMFAVIVGNSTYYIVLLQEYYSMICL